MSVKRPLAVNQPQIGKLIREVRLEANLTQEQFAAQLGVTFSSVSRWERGLSRPSPLAMQKIEGMLQKMGAHAKDLLMKHFLESKD